MQAGAGQSRHIDAAELQSVSWVEEAANRLEAGRRADGAWSYRASPSEGDPATEPTALAAMALQAHGRDAEAPLDWLARVQRPDGGFSTSLAHDESNWSTAIAALALLAGGRPTAGEAGVTWLLNESTYTVPVTPDSPYGYDTSLSAWPWTPGDFSWVEPTALAILAISRSSRAADPHVEQGRQLLLDRAAFDGWQGGWNYGEPRVLGANLSPAVAPTALAVLALQGAGTDLTQAVAFLQSRRDSLTSLFSLAWAANAMAAIGGLDDAWQAALAQTWAGASTSPTRDAAQDAISTALALLAIADRTKNPLIPG